MDVYDDEHKDRYIGRTKTRLQNPPHLYAVVQECYNGLFQASNSGFPPQDQAILVTGESGSGKTFNVRKILGFLDRIIEKERAVKGGEASEHEVESLTESILRTRE